MGCAAALLGSESVERAAASPAEAAPELAIQAPVYPVIADWPFDVTTLWRIDGVGQITVAIIRGDTCGQDLESGLHLDPYGTIVASATVRGSGRRVDEATIVTPGSYLVCGYLHLQGDAAGAGDVVRQARVEIATYPSPPAPAKFKACGRVGGPRHITHLRARMVSCRRARSVARRWASRSPSPTRVGRYACHARGRAVRCTAPGDREVRFRAGDRKAVTGRRGQGVPPSSS